MKPDYTNTLTYKLWFMSLAASAITLVYKALPSVESFLFIASFMALVYLTYQDIKTR